MEAQLTQALRARGQRVTTQRLLLLRALHELGRHATADELLRAVQRRLPALALPTVYATLDLLEGLGLVRGVATSTGPALYDPVLDGHHHLACRRCGAVVDVPADLDLGPALAAAGAAGHRPLAAEVVLSGTCAACARTSAVDTGVGG